MICPFCGCSTLVKGKEPFHIADLDPPVLPDDPDSSLSGIRFECLGCLKSFWIEDD